MTARARRTQKRRRTERKKKRRVAAYGGERPAARPPPVKAEDGHGGRGSRVTASPTVRKNGRKSKTTKKTRRTMEMRRSNWKTKVLVVLAVALGVAAGVLVRTIAQGAIGAYATPLAFLAGGLVALAAVYVGAGIMGIGGD